MDRLLQFRFFVINIVIVFGSFFHSMGLSFKQRKSTNRHPHLGLGIGKTMSNLRNSSGYSSSYSCGDKKCNDCNQSPGCGCTIRDISSFQQIQLWSDRSCGPEPELAEFSLASVLSWLGPVRSCNYQRSLAAAIRAWNLKRTFASLKLLNCREGIPISYILYRV